MTSGDATSLDRFVHAQQGTYATALQELRAGRKRSHWMWFIFPQLKGLGRSDTAQFYGIADLAEAQAYLAHPTLGARLLECTRTVLALQPRPDLETLLGSIDALKFGSCMTLFSRVPGAPSEFAAALTAFREGGADERTLALLESREG